MFSKYGCGNNAHQPGDVDFCSCFSDGYEAGKEKAYFEMEHWSPNDHHPSCGCQPCTVAKHIIGKISGQAH